MIIIKKNSGGSLKSLSLCICGMKILYMKLKIRKNFVMKWITSCLTRFFPMFSLEIITKHEGLLRILGGIEREHWEEMG